MLQSLKNTVAHILPKKTAPPAPPAAPAPPQKNPPPDAIATEVLLAWAMPQKNPRLLTAYKPDTDPTNPTQLLTVNVRANHNFMRGMKLRCRRVSAGVYDLVGPLPRWKGRW